MFGVLAFFTTIAQTSDTVSQAAELQKQGLYKQQYALLAQYRKSHPGDVNAEWLYAQSAFYLGKCREMVEVYEANIKANNENYYLKLDYAFKLVEIGRLEKAKQLLYLYLPYDNSNAQIYAALTKIAIWQSKYNEALWSIKKAEQLAPQNADYYAMEKQIITAKAPWISVGAECNKDNQPLTVISPKIEGGKYFSSLAMVDASVQEHLFDTTGKIRNATIAVVGNTSVFAKQGVIVRAQAGMCLYPDKETKFNGLLSVDKQLIKGLSLTAAVERKPYLMMLGSIDTSIATTNLSMSAKWEREKGFMGQFAYSVSLFDDKNNISTKSAWMVSPALNLWRFSFRCGYGYSFTTSKTDMFVPQPTMAQLLIDIYSNQSVSGKFSPYLTPVDQQVHSVIGVVGFNPMQRLQLNISGSYGFAASIKSPYLIGYYNAQSSVTVDRYYYTEKYTTLDIKVKADYRVTSLITAKAEYRHSAPNYYYTNNYIAVGLKMILCNGKSY